MEKHDIHRRFKVIEEYCAGKPGIQYTTLYYLPLYINAVLLKLSSLILHYCITVVSLQEIIHGNICTLGRRKVVRQGKQHFNKMYKRYFHVTCSITLQ